MTHVQRLNKLDTIGWHDDETSGRHQICGERCDWIAGKIDGVQWSAWISEVSGMVYLHGNAMSKELDFKFDEFCVLVRDGWPVPKAAPAARGLFDGDDE
jgi:hypothetical protein